MPEFWAGYQWVLSGTIIRLRYLFIKMEEEDFPVKLCVLPDGLPALRNSPMLIRAIAFLLVFAQVVLAQQPTPIVPDPKLTPGDTFEVRVQDLCVRGYTKKVRNVPAAMKREVYRKCGITSHGSGDYEVDHLIPLELGGSNSIKNLWPESHRTSPWNAQVKDRLEGKLHELVCSGQLDLKTAQQAIASNWIEAYKTYVSPDSPTSRLALPAAAETPQRRAKQVARWRIWADVRFVRFDPV